MSIILEILLISHFNQQENRNIDLGFCEEDPEIALGDRIVKVFYNCTCLSDGVSEEIKAFFRYIRTGIESSELTRHIDAAVKSARQNEKWRSDYMKERFIFDDIRREGYAEGREEGIELGIEKGIEQGIEQGREETKREIYKVYVRCIEAGLSEEQARELSGWKGELVEDAK